MTVRPAKILVMGFGSEILTDDGIAIKIIEQLLQEFNPELFEFKTDNLISLETVQALSGYKKIILIDAVTKNKEAYGQVNSSPLKYFKGSLHLNNIHDISIHQLNKIAKYLSLNISDDILVITVKIKENEFFSSSLSGDLNNKFKRIYKEIIETIRNYCLEEEWVLMQN